MKPLFRAVIIAIILIGTAKIASGEKYGISGSSIMESTAMDSVYSDSTVVDSALIAEIERDMILLQNLDLISELELFTNYELLTDEEFDVSVSSDNEIEIVPGE